MTILQHHGQTMQTGAALTEAPGPRSLRDELRDATHVEHQELEAAMDLMRPDFDQDAYGRLLLRYLDFYAAFEAFMHDHAVQQSTVARFYCRDRLKKPWLAADLEALGLDASRRSSELTPVDLTHLFPSERALLGAVYVAEGSTLGGAVLSKQFRKRFALAPEKGLRFFSGYGAATREKWLATLALLDELDPRSQESRMDVIEGARNMFLLFRHHVGARECLEPEVR